MRRLAAWWFAPGPAVRLAAVRILVGGFALAWLVGRLPELLAVARLPAASWHPTGVTRLLAGPLPEGVVVAAAGLTCALLVGVVVGAWYRVTAPAAAVLLLGVLTYRSSWGMVFHTENLLVLHLLALAAAPAADAWAWDARGGARPAPAAGWGWPLKLLTALTVFTYVLAGIAKLRLAGWGWLDGEQLRNQIAIDNLRKALLGDGVAPLGRLFLEHPAGFAVFSVLTLVLELGAPVALVGPRLARGFAATAWSFHLGVVLLMNIWFVYPLAGIAYASMLPVERPVGAVGRRLARVIRRTRE